MANRKRTKKGALKAHSRERFLERYDVDITNEEYEEIIKSIQQKGTYFARVIESQSDTRTLFLVIFNNIELFVVYNSKFKELSTVLTREQVEISYGKDFIETEVAIAKQQKTIHDNKKLYKGDSLQENNTKNSSTNNLNLAGNDKFHYNSTLHFSNICN